MPATQIKIGDNAFQINAPYVAGHALTEIEANVLNRVFCENISNNVRKKLAESEDKSFAALDAIVQAKAVDYAFTQREAAEPREKLSPVEREALTLILDAIKRKLTAAGKNPKDYKAEDLKSKAKEILASEKGAPFLEKAKKIVASRQKAADDLDGFDF